MIDPTVLGRALAHVERVVVEVAKEVDNERSDEWFWRAWVADLRYVADRLAVLRQEITWGVGRARYGDDDERGT